MREMAIPPFPRKFENPDLGNLLRTRLSQKVVLWPDQAIPLAGYICHPNDPAAREELLGTLKSWSDGSETVPPHLGRIQHEWLRVADVLHHCTDLIDGQHQKKRGGPSIGKAIALVEGKAKRRGTGAANLWKRWKRYKDVAHLATAAVLICGTRSAGQSFGPFGLSSDQLGPFQMAMMPDLVLAVANVAPLPPPTRTVTGADIGLLNARRAGNRGRANQHESTPGSDQPRPASLS